VFYGRRVVQLVKTTVKGKTVWAEETPETCFIGHAELRPATGCPHCHMRVRVWKCAVPGCGDVRIDPDHECRDGPLPASALRGA